MEKSGGFDYSNSLVHSDVLLELSPNMVIYLDQENRICKMSKAARIYLLKDESFDPFGHNIYSLIKHPVLTLFMKKWGEKLNKGLEVDETFPVDLNERDRYEWFQIRARNVDNEGRLCGKVYFISNVTELYSQKKILDTLMGSFPGDVLVFDRTLRILLVSDSLARKNGFHSWRDVAGHSLNELPKFDVAHIETLLDRIILSDEPFHEVVKYARSGEGTRWFYLDIRTIKSTAGVFGYILTQFDITDEIKPKAILEAIMDSSSDAISIVNPDGTVEYASRAMVQAIGIDDWRSVINHHWSYMFRSFLSNNGGFIELFSGNPAESRQGSISTTTAEGKNHYNYRVDPLNYQKENFGIITISSNTTELVAARERAESAVHAKAAFLANMSHELRTPMNAVLGMNELLSRTPLTSLQKNYSEHIRSSATLLLSIINDILDYSRMEDWKLGLNSAPYGFAGMLQVVINQVSLKMGEKELSFTVDLDPAIPSTLVGDEIRVRQILINLLNNAVKFTDRGEINLSVSLLHVSEKSSTTIAFKIRDTGIGIPKARQAEVFERFSRIESDRNSSVEGSGLGLSICKGLVSLMNGSLMVESEEGVGSVFTARIMQSVPPGTEPLARFNPESTASVLVYEPDAATLASIKKMCSHAGVKAEYCSAGEQFESFLSDSRFVWTHVIFEYKTGYARALSAASRHTTVRWLALLSMTDFIGKGKDPSIDFLFKPFLITAFARFLKGERVDFSMSLPITNTLGLSQPFFRANGASVLVVDDNTVNRKVAEGFLQTLDIRVDEAESGEEAIVKAGETAYDLILLDHLMPGMDGIETATKLRALAICRTTPIIALTANAGDSYAEMYRKAGMNDVLHKPIDFSDFVACLKKWLPASKQMEPPSSKSEVAGVEQEEIAPASQWIPGLDREMGIGFTGSLQNLEMILKVFSRTGPKMLEQLESGRRSGNPSQFRTAAHSLVSSCANVGGVELSAMARELEQAIIGGKNEAIDRLYPEVHAALEKIIAGVKDHIGVAAGTGAGGSGAAGLNTPRGEEK